MGMLRAPGMAGKEPRAPRGALLFPLQRGGEASRQLCLPTPGLNPFGGGLSWGPVACAWETRAVPGIKLISHSFHPPHLGCRLCSTDPPSPLQPRTWELIPPKEPAALTVPACDLFNRSLDKILHIFPVSLGGLDFFFSFPRPLASAVLSLQGQRGGGAGNAAGIGLQPSHVSRLLELCFPPRKLETSICRAT